MEAWLKFRAPGMTLPIGLGVGRLVFKALNMMELALSFAIAASIIRFAGNRVPKEIYLFIAPFIILIVQMTWLLPALDVRAEMVIMGTSPPPSNLHFLYIILEMIKVICLAIFGIKLFKI